MEFRSSRRDPRLRHVCAASASALALFLSFPGAGHAAEELRIGGTGSGLGTMRLLSSAFAKQNPGVNANVVESLGTSGGLKALAKAAIEVAVISRPLKEDERKRGLAHFEYGRSPFVFAVSARSSKVTEVRLAQIADIYAGRLKQWPDRSEARVVLRPAGDGDTDLLKSMSPAIRQAVSAAEARPGVPIAVNDQEAADDIEKIPGAVGPMTLALIVSEKRPLRALKLDGVEPTAGNAASGAYPYVKRLFLVTRDKPAPVAQRFVAFVQSAAGREILTRNGHWVP